MCNKLCVMTETDEEIIYVAWGWWVSPFAWHPEELGFKKEQLLLWNSGEGVSNRATSRAWGCAALLSNSPEAGDARCTWWKVESKGVGENWRYRALFIWDPSLCHTRFQGFQRGPEVLMREIRIDADYIKEEKGINVLGRCLQKI